MFIYKNESFVLFIQYFPGALTYNMANRMKDILLEENSASTLLQDKHAEFLKEYGKKENSFEYGITDYLRVSGMYWALTALEIMKTLPSQGKNEVCVIKFIFDEAILKIHFRLLSTSKIVKTQKLVA